MEQRTGRYDWDLGVEVSRFEGLEQAFPSHFHTDYLLGLMEGGRRTLTLGNRTLVTGPGDLFLLNPGDCHGCTPLNGEPLSYRGMTVPVGVMAEAAEQVTGRRQAVRFPEPVRRDPVLAETFRQAHQSVLEGGPRLEREERFLFLMVQLLPHSAEGPPPEAPEPEGLRAACALLEREYAQPLSLERLAAAAGMSKYAFLRAFTRYRGITPYRCLETIRVNRARDLLRQGADLSSAALETGFADQSHFTNSFRDRVGLTPGRYRALFQGEETP